MLAYKGKNHRLSHLYACPITINGMAYNSAEQAYQMLQSTCAEDYPTKLALAALNHGMDQKKKAKEIKPYTGSFSFMWAHTKQLCMLRIDYEKFTQNAELKQYLLSTSPKQLVEDLPDMFWGWAAGRGENQAGNTLMTIRKKLQSPGLGTLPTAIIVGDSLVKGIAEYVEEAKVVAIPGGRRNFITSVAAMVAGPYVKVVIVLCGTNDLVSKRGEVAVGSKIVKKLITWAKTYAEQNTQQKLVLTTVLPRACNANSKVDHHLEVIRNRLMGAKDEGSLPSNVLVLDVHRLFMNLDYFAHDGLHLSRDGKILLGALMRHTVRYSLGLEEKAQPFLITK